MAINKYRVYCNVDNKYEYVIANSAPTVCPINPAHSIDLSQVVTVEEDIKLNDGTATDLILTDYKQLRFNQINIKTGELIKAGFIYDSKTFGSELEDRVNFGHMKQFELALPWPLDIFTKNGDVYSLAQANLDAFIGAALTHTNTVLQGGNALKDAISAATDEAGVDAVVDNR